MKTTRTQSLHLDAPSSERLWCPDEVGEAIRWHAESVRRAIRDGRIPAVKVGRGWRVRGSVVSKLVQQGL